MSIPHIKERLNASIRRNKANPEPCYRHSTESCLQCATLEATNRYNSTQNLSKTAPSGLQRIPSSPASRAAPSRPVRGPARAICATLLIMIGGLAFVPGGSSLLSSETFHIANDPCGEEANRDFALLPTGQYAYTYYQQVGASVESRFALTAPGSATPTFSTVIPTTSAACPANGNQLGPSIEWLGGTSFVRFSQQSGTDVQVSTNNGVTWLNVAADPGVPITNVPATTMSALDEDSWMVLFEILNNGLFYSYTDDAGATWTSHEIASTGSGTICDYSPPDGGSMSLTRNGPGNQFRDDTQTFTDAPFHFICDESGAGTDAYSCDLFGDASETCTQGGDFGIVFSQPLVICKEEFPLCQWTTNPSQVQGVFLGSAVPGTTVNTYDVALERADYFSGTNTEYTFFSQLTLGEDLVVGPFEVFTDAETWTRLFMFYPDDESGELVFAEIDPVTGVPLGCLSEVSQCQDSFQSAGIGVPTYIRGVFVDEDDNIILYGTDDTASTSTGKGVIITVSGLLTPSAGIQQIPVNDLTQADVDITGTIIITREDSGETVNTYNANSLNSLGTFPTPDCAIYAGVSSIRTSRDYFTSFGACDVSGDVDTLWVKSESLTEPNFLDGCGTEFCKENNAQFDTVGGMSFDVPADVHALGTISAIPYSFEESTTTNLNNGYASWTFSTLSGEIGVLGVSYNQAGADNGDRELVDINPGGDIHAFCSWRNPDNDQDYIAGVSDGPTVFAEASATVSQDAFGNSDTVNVEAEAIIQNIVPFGFATGISCSRHQALVDTSNSVYLVNITAEGGVTALGEISWIEPKDGFTLNEVAMSPSGLFGAWRDGNSIRVVHVGNHTNAGNPLSVPSGTWRGIEFDQKGGRLFVYTNDFITIYDISADTCQLNCSADQNEFSEPLPGTGGDGDGDGAGDGGVLAILDSPYFWILFWILVIEVIIAAISWATRAGFGGHVYLIAGTVVYIFGMLFDGIDGTQEVSPWPLVVLCAVSVGSVIANFRR